MTVVVNQQGILGAHSAYIHGEIVSATVPVTTNRQGISNGFYGGNEHAVFHDNVTELQRQRSILDRLSIRMKSASMHNALISWDLNVKEQQWQRANLEKMALEMQSAEVCKGWARWAELLNQKRKMRCCAEKISVVGGETSSLRRRSWRSTSPEWSRIRESELPPLGPTVGL